MQEIKIEKVEDFNDEYVYDLEVDDGSHTFFANDILVHNSIYVRMDNILKLLFKTTKIDWYDDATFEKIKGFVDTKFQNALNNHVAAKDFKSEFVGCKHCGSKINREYIKSNACPVCRGDMRSDTTQKRLENMRAKVNRLRNDIKDEENFIDGRRGTLCPYDFCSESNIARWQSCSNIVIFKRLREGLHTNDACRVVGRGGQCVDVCLQFAADGAEAGDFCFFVSINALASSGFSG